MMRKDLPHQVADSLYKMIADTQEFRPGDKLPGENTLSDRLGISRSTLLPNYNSNKDTHNCQG